MAGCGADLLGPELLDGPLTLTASAFATDGRNFGDCTLEGAVAFTELTETVAEGTGIVHDSTRFGNSVGVLLRNRIDTIPVVLRTRSNSGVQLELRYPVGLTGSAPPLILAGETISQGFGGEWTCQTDSRLTVTGTWVLSR